MLSGKYIEICTVRAIYKENRFKVVLINKDICIGCKKYEDVCPNEAIKFEPNGKMTKCNGCIERLSNDEEPVCVRACPTKVIFMDEGQIKEQGSPKEFFENPKHPRLQEFLSKIL